MITYKTKEMDQTNGSEKLLSMFKLEEKKNLSQQRNGLDRIDLDDQRGIQLRELLNILEDPDNTWHQFILGM